MRRTGHIGVAIALALLVAAGVVVAGVALGRRPARGPRAAPPQPIAFSHQAHSGELGLSCLFCHGNAARAADANIPSARDCYVCHWAVGEGKPEIVKLEKLVKEATPIHWRKVVRLPDHVQFDHEPHVRRGIECQVCHGQVDKMEATFEALDLSMGFCVECHWQHQASNDCLICHR